MVYVIHLFYFILFFVSQWQLKLQVPQMVEFRRNWANSHKEG